MRLICANCAAQYEIAASAIPPAGREVKCSACGHVWHQAPPPAFGDALPLSRRPVDAEALRILREEAAREAQVRAARAAPARAAAPAGDRPVESAVPEAAAAHPPAVAPEPAAPPQPVSVPEAVALPEPMAQQEAAVQTAPAGSPDPAPQPDPAPSPAAGPAEAPVVTRVDRAIPDVLPVAPRMSDDPALPDRAAAEPLAPATLSDSPRAAPVAKPTPAARLPDPKLATSTLEPAAPPRRTGRFGTGFLLGLLVVAALAGLYLVAPGLAEEAPAAAPYLGAYVAAVDAARLWLDDTARPLIDRLRP